MAQLTAKVEKVTQPVTVSTNGQITRDFQVQYTVGEHGPFTITVPAAEFNPEKVNQLMQETAQTIQTLTQ